MTSPARTWFGFAAMCLGMFMAILDVQVVASSLTTIQSSLGVRSEDLSWIQTAYLISEVIAVALTGWLTRALSLRWLYVGATVAFTLASIGCALCTNVESLIAVRALQGIFGGMLIPAVFTSVFTLLPERDRVLATTIAGTFAVVAPTVGPAVGGYLTQTYSWHWIFLINVVPGLLVSASVALCIRSGAASWAELRRIDFATALLASVFLGSLQLLLKEAPLRDWHGPYVGTVAVICAVAGVLTVQRSLRVAQPLVDLRWFQHLSFSLGAVLSFVLGAGLYGSVYILSLFLGQVRHHTPLEIGEIMMVSGGAQLLTAPLAARLETRIDPRLLTAIGFGLFGLGLLANGFATARTDFDGLFWPQILRGVSVLLCLLPAARLALDAMPPTAVAEASALFNLMRNLGGAIGIALIDTILEQRTPHHVADLVAHLQAGDPVTARFVGLPLAGFHNMPLGPVDEITKRVVAPLVERAALVRSFNEAWYAVAALFALSLLVLPAMRRANIKDSAMGPGTVHDAD